MVFSGAALAGVPLHEVLYQWELGPAQSAYTALTETADGSFISTSASGGAQDLGCVFRMTPAGAITVLAHFSGNGAVNKGAGPVGRLILGTDGAYYGMTDRGGAGGFGTIFKVTLTGELTTLVEFTGTGGSAKGARPSAGLTIGGDGAFYGTTREGGTTGHGTVFRMTVAGEFTTLAEFNYFGPNSNGASPSAALTADSDGNLYGTTRSGGANGIGTLFSITTTGTLATLVNFTGDGATNRGSYPTATLVESGGDFFGTTQYGGADSFGTVFKVTKQGVLTTLVEFTGNGAANKGSEPTAGLTLGSDGTLFGTTASGGAFGFGTIFKMTTAGELTTLVEFTDNGASNRGAAMYAGLTLASDGAFYGSTYGGGGTTQGTFFKMTTSGTLTTLAEVSIRGAMGLGGVPEAGLVRGADGNFYGVTRFGGAHGFGTVFKFTPDGQFTKLVDFTGVGGVAKGAYPTGELALGLDGNMYGATVLGSTGNSGTVFKMTASGEFTTLAEFPTVNGNATSGPEAGLTLGSDGNFYGTTYAGGRGRGTVFKLTAAGELTTLVEFTGTEAPNPGQFPGAGLTEGEPGVFYGTTLGGGGTIFKVTSTGMMTTLLNVGTYPVAELSLGPDGSFYGSMTSGGIPSGGADHGPGSIFKLSPTGELTTLVELSGSVGPDKGREILGRLTLGEDGNFYGTSSRGGVLNKGTLFKMTPTGVLTTLFEFGSSATSANGAGPSSELTLGTDGHFYGTTSGGGPGGGGTVFRLRESGGVSAQVLAATGGDVSGEPGGTRFKILGQPVLNSTNGTAFIATLRTGIHNVKAVLAGSPPQVVARAGDVAPGTDGASFASFGPPLISEAGVAFSAKLRRGPGVNQSNDSGVWTTAFGNGLTLVARCGSAAPGVAGSTLKRISTFSLRGAEIALLLRLNATANDDVLVHLDSNGPVRLLGEGDSLDVGEGAKPVKKLTVFTPSASSPGQDRWHAPGVLAANVTFADGKLAVLELRPGEAPRVLGTTGSQVPAELGHGRWKGFDSPAVGAPGMSAIRGRQTPDGSEGIVAIEHSPAQLLYPYDFHFLRPSDPVINDQGKLALVSSLILPGATGVQNQLRLLAGFQGSLGFQTSIGDSAPDAYGISQADVRYAKFKSFGLPDGSTAGPLFIATLTGRGVRAHNRTALFAADSAGRVRRLLQTGDSLNVEGVPREVAKFSALTGGALPVGTRRAFDKAGSVVALVTFTNHSQAVVRIEFP